MVGDCTGALDPVVLDGLERGIAPSAETDALAGPFVEGGRARDIVELCDKLDLPAVFLDRTQHVLHVSAQAQASLGFLLTIENGFLIARGTPTNTALQGLIEQAVDSSHPRAVRRIMRIPNLDAGDLSVIALDYPNTSPYQFLRAVLVLGNDDLLNGKLTVLEDHLNAK